MVRECRPPAREPARSWLARRSTMATSTLANANSPANISPVGPAPAITTACPFIATLPVRRPRATYTPTSTHASRDSHFRRFRPRPTILRHDPGLAASPPVRYTLRVEGSGYPPFPLSSAVDE